MCPIESRYIALFGKYLGQCTPLNEIHNEVMPATLNEEVADARNTGMVELQQKFRLALKPIHGLAAIDIALEIIEHLLDGTWLIVKARIYGTIHCTHTTSRKRFFNFVASTRKERVLR